MASIQVQQLIRIWSDCNGLDCHHPLSDRDISRRLYQRPDRLCGRAGRLRHLAAHPVADGGADRAYGIVNQGYGIWKVRQAMQWGRILRFAIGGAVGVPLGAYLVTYIDPAKLRLGVGVLLIAYSVYNLARATFTRSSPTRQPTPASAS
jgi:hypothetical protein